MTESRFRLRPPPFFVALIGPLVLGVLLNAVVRPALASQLGGTLRVSGGAAVRGQDRWWVFDAATRADHPMLTGFLSASDGAVAMLMIVLMLLCFAWRFLDPRIRVFLARRAAAMARRSSAGS